MAMTIENIQTLSRLHALAKQVLVCQTAKPKPSKQSVGRAARITMHKLHMFMSVYMKMRRRSHASQSKLLIGTLGLSWGNMRSG